MSIVDYAELAKTRFDHALHRKAMQERVEAQLVVAHNGGVFKATPELFGFLALFRPEEKTLYLKDEHGNPIKCDREQLQQQLEEAYQYAMNAWYIEFEESKKVRKLEDV